MIRVGSIYVDADIPCEMTARIDLIRHCEHAEVGVTLSGRRAGLSLTEIGRARAARLGKRYASRPPTRILSSPRERARETAAAIAGASRGRVEVIDALDEIDFGVWEGMRFDALDEDPAWRLWNEERGSAATPGGETMAAIVARTLGVIDGIEDGEVVCITHCDLIRGVVAQAIGLSFDNMLRFDVDPGSVTTLVRAPGGLRLAGLNGRAE